MKKKHIALLVLMLALVLAWLSADKSGLATFLDSKKAMRLITTQRVIDTNANGHIEPSEIITAKERLLLYDKNKDGILSNVELGGPGTPEQNIRSAYMVRVIDTNNDAEFSKEELDLASERILIMDKNKDGIIDRQEIAAEQQ